MNTPGRLRVEKVSIGSPGTETLLEEVRTRKCTGYVQIEFRDFEFLLFIERGTPTHGFRVIEDQLFSFSNLTNTLDSLKGGHLRFYETSPRFLQALLDTKFGDQIYGTLHTSFCDLEKLFHTLEQEKCTGSVEIDLPSVHCFVVVENGAICEIISLEEKEEKKEKEREETLEFILGKAAEENGTVRVFERRNPPTILSPDPEKIFVWSDPRRLKLEFAFGQLGKEFENLLDQKMTLSQILNVLCVDFVEIADMYTYLSAKGYIVTRKKAN